MKQYLTKISSDPFVKNYLKIFSVDVLVKGAGIILLPVYLRLMTQDEFGLYGYLVAIVGTFSLVFNLGIYVAQSKLYHDYPDEKRGVVLFTLNVLLLAAMLLFFALVFAFRLDYWIISFLFKNPIDYDKYRLAVLLGVVVAVYSVMLTNYFLTSEDFRKVQLFNISRIVLINTFCLTALYFTMDVDHAFIRLEYSNLIEFGVIVAFSFYYVSKMRMHFDSKIAVRALKIASPILASAVLGIFINLSDRYFIEKYGTLRDLSIYNVALTFSGIIPFVFASFQNVWLPQFLKEKDFQFNQAKSKKVTSRLLVIFISLSLAIALTLKGMLIVNVIDAKYDAIMPLLPIVLLTATVSSISPMYSNHLIYLDKLYLIVVIGIPIAVLGIVLNMSLVPSYNIYGAAFSTLVTNSCYLVSYIFIVDFAYKKKMKARP